MNDPNTAVEALKAIGAELRSRRDQFDLQLRTTFERLKTAPERMQWVMDLSNPWDPGSEIVRDVVFFAAWCPDGYVPRVGQFAPHPRSNMEIVSFRSEVIPQAQTAIDRFGAAFPEFESLSGGTIRDVDSLIQFPERVAYCFQGWKNVQNRLATLPADIARAGDLDGFDSGSGSYGWQGDGADAYRRVVAANDVVAKAVLAGVGSVLEGFLSLIEVCKGVCEALSAFILTRIQKVAAAFEGLLGRIKNPLGWDEYVALLVSAAKSSAEEQHSSFIKRVDDLLNVARMHNDLDKKFVELKSIAGAEGGESLLWPSSVMGGPWRPKGV